MATVAEQPVSSTISSDAGHSSIELTSSPRSSWRRSFRHLVPWLQAKHIAAHNFVDSSATVSTFIAHQPLQHSTRPQLPFGHTSSQTSISSVSTADSCLVTPPVIYCAVPISQSQDALCLPTELDPQRECSLASKVPAGMAARSLQTSFPPSAFNNSHVARRRLTKRRSNVNLHSNASDAISIHLQQSLKGLSPTPWPFNPSLDELTSSNNSMSSTEYLDSQILVRRPTRRLSKRRSATAHPPSTHPPFDLQIEPFDPLFLDSGCAQAITCSHALDSSQVPFRPSFLRSPSNRRWTLADAGNATDQIILAELHRLKTALAFNNSPEQHDEKRVMFEDDWIITHRALFICRELLLTERGYEKRLRAMLLGKTSDPNTLTLISHLPALIQVSQSLLSHWESDSSSHSIASAFLKHKNDLETAFTNWASFIGIFIFKHDTSGSGEPSTLAKSRLSQRTHVRLFLGTICGQQENGMSLSMREAAIEPTQRVTRYVLLFEDLLHHTPHTSLSRGVVAQALVYSRWLAKRCDELQTCCAH